MRKVRDLSGQKFGRLRVVRYIGRKGNQTMWECLCECGKPHIASTTNLVRGHVQSCGCLRKEVSRKQHTTHGDRNTRLYRIWDSMKRRCNGTNGNKDKKYYCDRGISVCQEWMAYENFRDWAVKNGYRDDLTIDRIDVNGNYCPENCRWATMREQENNRRNNHYVTYDGKTQTIGEWASETGIPYDTLYGRLYSGWPMEKALACP